MHRWPGKVWQTTDNIAGAPTDTPDQVRTNAIRGCTVSIRICAMFRICHVQIVDTD